MMRPHRACAKDIDYSLFDKTPSKKRKLNEATPLPHSKSTPTPKKTIKRIVTSSSKKIKPRDRSVKKKVATPASSPRLTRLAKKTKEAGQVDNGDNKENEPRANKQRSPPKVNAAAKALSDKIGSIAPCTPAPRRTPNHVAARAVVDAKYNRLLERYEELKALRVTEQEQSYKRLKTVMDEHKAVSNHVIEQLKAENKRLQEENDELHQHTSEPSGIVADKKTSEQAYKDISCQLEQTRKKVASLTAQLEEAHKEAAQSTVQLEHAHKQTGQLTTQLEQASAVIIQKDQKAVAYKDEIRRLQERAASKEASKPVTSASLSGGIVDFYEMITSLKVQPLGNNKFLCTCNRSPLKFEVGMNNFEVEYTPLELNTEGMPECLKEAIYFSKSEWPVFLAKIITTVFSKDRD